MLTLAKKFGFFREQRYDSNFENPRLATDVGRSEQFFPFYSGVSMLKDGSVLGVLDFFNPVRQIVL